MLQPRLHLLDLRLLSVFDLLGQTDDLGGLMLSFSNRMSLIMIAWVWCGIICWANEMSALLCSAEAAADDSVLTVLVPIPDIEE